MRKALLLLSGLAALVAVPSCLSSNDDDDPDAIGVFYVEGTNLLPGATWELNRPIRLEFNHSVDPTSVSFGAIQIRALNPSQVSQPVTGTFEFEEGSANRVIIFRPTCPTNQANSNGAFVGGGIQYELYLPTAGFSPTVLRDANGRPLSSGLRRAFSTPLLSQPQFLDLLPGPPQITDVSFPEGVNMFNDADPIVEIVFNQAIDGRASNLNTNNLYILYASGEIGTANEDVYPLENKVPGRLVLMENCGDGGALVNFVISGVLPVNRNIRLEMGSNFSDLIGQTNISVARMTPHEVPTLAAVYNDPSWNESDPTVDEFTETFTTASRLDLTAEIPLPLADIGEGFIAAEFDYPGGFTGSDNDFYLSAGSFSEVFTDGQSVFTDSNNRQHTLQNGVLRVDDFELANGATLRGRGTNPLVIYATGTVTLDGTINISGNNSNWPTSLNSPQFSEGGAGGECGGGRGGDASQIGTAETPRADRGDGAFGLAGGGGQGGEGGFNGDKNGQLGTTGIANLHNTVAGGGGGGFARTENAAVWWEKWPIGQGWKPSGIDNGGPDHYWNISAGGLQKTRHTALGPKGSAISREWFAGAEDGMRGSSYQSGTPLPTTQSSGIYGMEDVNRDDEATPYDTTANLDPAWTFGAEPPFPYGHPTKGPDGGQGGPSIFTADGDLQDDFWGRRLNADGSVSVGELLAPWAGSGGGGGGDSMLIHREDFDGDMVLDPIASLYPVVPFQRSTFGLTRGWYYYRKGAAGGGGAGQLLIMAIGQISVGANGSIKANGGIGFTGESLINSDNTVSGSGGGSGGHVVLHSATGMDLSAVSVGTSTVFSSLTPQNNVQAFGGRRGWAAPDLQKVVGSSIDDGNATFMIGRGGAGANGVIQIHVPDPFTDIVWPTAAQTAIQNHLAANPDVDGVEEVLDLFCEPAAYSLIPFYSSSSMVQSKWVDTGLAGLRRSTNQTPGNWDFPDYRDPLLDFSGIFPTTGLVAKQGQSVIPLANIATGGTGAVTIASFGMTVPSASSYFDAKFLRSPNLLKGYDIRPDRDGEQDFEIVSASYDRGADQLVLSSRVNDGAMDFAVNPANPFWSVKEKFFRIETAGVKDGLPDSTEITLEFQGANESFAGSGVPGVAFPGERDWTSDLNDLQGFRYIRYRVTFEADAQGTGIGLDSPLPLIDYLKVPFVW